VIEQAVEEWQAFCAEFGRFSAHLNRNRAVNVNSESLREATKHVAQYYFRSIRQSLQQFNLDELVEPLSVAFEALLVLSEGRNSASSYKRHAKAVRKIIPRVTSQLEVQGGGVGPSISSSETDKKILDTLTKLIPSAAQSYQQALFDLADTRRVSFRGAAHELPESLREVLDHLAPDAEVVKSEGFKFEKDHKTGKDLTKPTMKQKVRFVFKARERNATESAAPEDAVKTVDALIADLTRSTYDRGSLSAHQERGKKSAEQLKRYVDVIFHDLLEL
jgi:hypothetical protein